MSVSGHEATLEAVQAAAEQAQERAARLISSVDPNAVNALVQKLSRPRLNAPAEVSLCALATLAASECLSNPDPSDTAMIFSAFLSLVLRQQHAAMLRAMH